MIHFLCTQCKKALKAADGTEGKAFKCSGCNEPQIVPGGKAVIEEPVIEEEVGVVGLEPQRLPIDRPAKKPKPVEVKQEADAYSSLRIKPKDNTGKIIFVVIVTLLGAWCIYEWVMFAQMSFRHVHFINSRESVTMGESSYGIYALLATLIEPLAFSMVFFILIAISTLKTK